MQQIALTVLVGVTPVLAADQWEIVPEVRSETLAVAHWTLLTTTSISQPDRAPTLITIWQKENGRDVWGKGNGFLMVRCFDYFNNDFTATGGKCEQAIAK